MPPATGLAGILDSPVVDSSNGSTVVGGGGGSTLPDITLGSLGSSFHSAEEGDDDYGNESTDTAAPRRSEFARTPAANKFDKHGGGLYTPAANVPSAAMLASPPPSTMPSARALRRAPRGGDEWSSDDEGGGALEARYGSLGDMSEEDGVLGNLSLNTSNRRGADLRASKGKRAGRHSVATGPSNQMTLREQEQNVDALQKENFNLQLENHFLKERLASMAPDNLESVVNENVKLRVEILTIAKELKKCKKLLMQQDRDLAAAARERDGQSGRRRERETESRELEGLYREEKEKREELEDEMERLREEQLDKIRQLEEDLDEARMKVEDQDEEMDKLRDAADRAEDELEKLRDEARGLSESVGLGRGRESRTIAKLEQEIADLKAELDEVRQRGSGGPGVEELEEQINELRDKFAAAQIDLERRDQEIDDLNNEIDAKIQEHEREIQAVEGEWRDELLEARGQVDELKDVLAERDNDFEEYRKAVQDREDELGAAQNRIAELEAVQGETTDRLEETLRHFEMDHAEKEQDLIAANREIESLGQRVFELEELVEELRAREAEFTAELQRSDEEKTHFEELVSALKEARKKLHEEREAVTARLEQETAARSQDAEQHRKTLALRDQTNERLAAEIEAARDRVAMRDRDLVKVQTALRSLEDERRKLGDANSSDQRSLELEMERLRRDLSGCEDDLDRARDELREREQALQDRELEVAELMDKQRDLEARLTTERQGRLNVSDKLDEMSKTAKQHERDAATLRERLDELEPLLTETQNARAQVQKESERQRQERTELLLKVFKDVNRFVGAEDNTTPANFTVFRDTLLQRLRSINGARSDYEKRIKDVETGMERKMAALKRQLDAKWRALDGFEASVKKLELQRSQHRTKLSEKEGELGVHRGRVAELQRELNVLRASREKEGGAGASSSSSSGGSGADAQRALERAERAEKRARDALASVSALEKRLAEEQSRATGAESKWEARVKEYENRLRIAGEKVKSERQGGKERTRQLEDQVKDLQHRIDQANVHNRRAEGVVANAAHLLDSNK